MLEKASVLTSKTINDGLKTASAKENISIAYLDTEKVTIKSSTVLIVNDVEVEINLNFNQIFNNKNGRLALENIQEPYKTAILAVWGDTSIFDDSEVKLSG